MSDYRVQLDVFSGPLDLLLYLVRRDEVDIHDIPLARVADQYLAYVRLLESLDPDAAGEFLVLAATLLEMKSRALLPTPPIEAEDEIEDSRSTLVRQLLEYKRFKDAARALGSAADDRQKRYVRRPGDLPAELMGVELEEVEIWDLVEAFGRVMSSIGAGPGLHRVRYDERPIEEYQAEIVETLERAGPAPFHTLFHDRGDRAYIVGLFLALLELVRRRRLRAEQDTVHAVIYLFLLDELDYVEPEAAPVPIAIGENTAEESNIAAADEVATYDEELSEPTPDSTARMEEMDADTGEERDGQA